MKRIREFDLVEERMTPLIESLQTDGIHTSLSPIIKSPEEALRGSPILNDAQLEEIINRVGPAIARWV
jgi:hypothetical protein